VIVLDASAVVDWLLRTPPGRNIEDRIYSRLETLHAPHLLDVEVVQVLRRLVRQQVIPASRADEAIDDLIDLRITRYPHIILIRRVWQLRNKFSAYDAIYLALAQQLNAALITRDSVFASASGHGAVVELF
jgi:predicted nucleic acid-binding protein